MKMDGRDIDGVWSRCADIRIPYMYLLQQKSSKLGGYLKEGYPSFP